MSDVPKLYIAGMGMITPVGFDTASTAAALRAGVSGYSYSEYTNNTCKRITMASVPDAALPEFHYDLETHEDINIQIGRMLLMSDIALKELYGAFNDPEPMPLFIAGPTANELLKKSFNYGFVDLLIKQTGLALDKSRSRLFATGRAGVMATIDLAFNYFGQGLGDYVVVGGVDSYQNYDLLLHLDQHDRIKAEDIPDGFVPGEAAAYLVLTDKPEFAQVYGSSRLVVSKPALGAEDGHMYGDKPYIGGGLALTMRQAIANRVKDDARIQCIYSSMNGENYWAKEYGVAVTRNKVAFSEDFELIHPAECYGDIGAATGAVLLGVASMDMLKLGKPTTSLIYCSSDHEARGAVCISLEG